MPAHDISYPTHPGLKRFIVHYALISGPLHIPFKTVMPRHGTTLLFDFNKLLINDEKLIDLAVAGFHTRSFTFRVTTDYRDCFVVRLSPYGLSRFTDMPISTLTNQIIPAESLFGEEIRHLYVAMKEQPFAARIALVDDFLLSRLREPNPSEEWIFDTADQLIQALSLKSLTLRVTLGKRQIERKFKEIVGVNMTTFVRICRFEKMTEQLPAVEHSLTSLAYEGGYFDQAHFSKDFKRLSTVSPKSYSPCQAGGQGT